ncbi:MAG: hypothetical protein AAGH82_09700 [Pseudomonadota bacterium]
MRSSARSQAFRRFSASTKAITTLEFSLVASAAALFLGMFLVPVFDRASDMQIVRATSNGGVDMTVTGSVRSDPFAVPADDKKVRYIFRSITQGKNSPPCIAYTNGSDNGHC